MRSAGQARRASRRSCSNATDEAGAPASHRIMQSVTVVVPVKHFHEPFLFEAIGSIQAQTNPSWFLDIVVEPAAVKAFQSLLGPVLADRRISLVENRGNALAGAINTGMCHA